MDNLASNMGKPKFKRFCLLTWNGLNDSKKLFCISHIRQSHLAIGSKKFQLLTNCKQLFCALIFESFFQNGPISTGTTRCLLIGKSPNNIHNREIPFFLKYSFGTRTIPP